MLSQFCDGLSKMRMIEFNYIIFIDSFGPFSLNFLAVISRDVHSINDNQSSDQLEEPLGGVFLFSTLAAHNFMPSRLSYM